MNHRLPHVERGDADEPSIETAAGEPPPLALPASVAQRRLWFVENGDVRASTYNVPAAFTLTGPLDDAVLERALAFMQQRHPALRSRFRTRDGELRIELAPQPAPLARQDLGALDADVRARTAERLCANHANRRFDLERDAPIRCLLLRLGENEHVLAVNVHHIVFDDWSIRIFFRELGAVYGALLAGATPDLPALDYAAAVAASVPAAARHAAARQYWARAMSGAPTLHKLPTDRPRPAEPRMRGAVHKHVFARRHAEGIRALCRRAGVTPYMLGVAAFAALLHRYSGEDEIVIGSPFANRVTQAQQSLIGFFINLIPLRVRFDAGVNFLDLLAQVRETSFDAFEHAVLPFDQIVDAIRPPRSSSHAPVFQIMFDYLKSGGMLELDGVGVTGSLVHTGTAKYDLTVSMEEGPDELAAIVEYDTDLFDAGTIARLGGHFERLLENVLASPAAPIAEGSLLPADELRQVRRFTRPDEPYAHIPFSPMPQRIREAARRAPHAVAIVHGDARMTYETLDRRSDALARALRARGVGRGSRVASLQSYSEKIVVAYLGILKAGAAYLPLDPADPRRLEKIEDAAPAMIVTARRDLEDVPQALRARTLTIDDPIECGKAPDAVNDAVNDVATDVVTDATARDAELDFATLAEADPAYVIYTSGSTGKPKGVEVSHGSLNVSYHGWHRAYRFGKPGHPVTLQLAGMTFDLGIGDVSRTLACGGTLVMPPRDGLLDAGRLHALMRAERVSFGDFPPVILRELIRHCNETGDRLDMLDTLVCGADVWFGHELHAARALCGPHARVLGSYGVTEAAIDSSYFDPDLHALAPDSVVPLGRPLPSCELLIVDPLLQMTPIGVPGELLVAGPAVATRYLNNDALTAQKFLRGRVDEHGRVIAGDGQTRFYRTGDICRFLEDGTIDFLGRRDNQIKIRGFRVELGEVEGVLAAHPDVRQCAVVVRDEASGDPSLAAFVVSDAPIAALRGYLRGRLPAYMLPAAIERLGDMPLTASGKIDRNRLKAWPLSAPDVPPPDAATDVERRLLALWENLLSARVPSVHENFFQWGGHSLAAARLASSISQAFDISIGVSSVFNHPSVAEQARLVEALASARAPRDVRQTAHADAAEPAGDDGLLSYSQQSLWLTAKRTPDDFSYNIPVTWRLDGPLDAHALERAINDVVARHDALRTVFSSDVRTVVGPHRESSQEPTQRVLDTLTIALRRVAVAPDDAASLPARLREAHSRAFDLNAGPLLRAVLFEIAPTHHVLDVTIHHIVIDGPSFGLFWRDLQTAYRARVAGEAPGWQRPARRHADFVSRQRQALRGEAAARQLAYWREQLRGLPAALPLPDAVLAAHAPGSARSLTFEMPDDVAAGLAALARRTNGSPFIVYLALFAAALRQQTGEADFAIGTPLSLRPHEGFADVLGFFANTMPLRMRLHGLDTFERVLRYVREQCLALYENGDVPFEYLVQALKPARAARRNPVFQTIFSCEFDDERLQLTGVDAHALALDAYTAKLDLEMAINVSGGRVVCHLMSRPGSFDADALSSIRHHFLRTACSATRAHAEREAAEARATHEVHEAHEAHEAHEVHEVHEAHEAHEVHEVHEAHEVHEVHEAHEMHDVHEARAQLADDAPGARRPSADDLFGLFARSAARHAQRVALDSPMLRASYAQLAERVSAAARALAAHGVRRGDRVGIFVGHHPHNVTAMLAIARVGAAFVPMDPEHKPQWNRHIVDDAALTALVGGAWTADAARGFGLPVVDLDAPPPPASELADAPAAGGAHPDDCAYVIYTSGSTGRPKGVAVSHASVCHNVRAMAEIMRIGPQSRMAQYVSPVFDVVLGEIFPALAAGAAIVFAERRRPLPGQALVDWLDAQRVSHVWIVPSALAMVPEAALPALEVLIVAGEACPRELAQRWAAGRRLLNGYGPTEAAIVVSLTDYHAQRERLILRPMGGARLHVLDEALRPAAAGAAGELFIGGACVAQGYLGQPARTAQAFVADPFDAEPGARMYRTGDVVRRLDDGAIQFIGRVDRQVKIRGFRIELDAVRAALMEVPGVQAAEALAQPDASGQPLLVGYVVARRAKAELLDALRGKVPDAMVPSTLVFLDALPTGSTGKTDLKALKALKTGDAARPAAAAADMPRAASQGRTLHRVREIWRTLLERDDIGDDENFFDAGGHSLRAVALHQRITEAFGDVIALTDLFEHPTIGALAAHLDAFAPRDGEAADDAAGAAARAPADGVLDTDAIAVIGLAGRFPDAPDLDRFWERLLAGYEAGRTLSDAELDAHGVPAELYRNPHFVRRFKELEGKAEFDAGFFGYSPREAQVMDPQQRIFLELAWQALEQAGYGDRGRVRSVGVFASAAFNYYLVQNVMPNAERLRLEPGQWLIGNDKDFIATRTAYKLNLLGPALSVGTACSSSLMAVHLACASLRNGEAQMALAGAVALDPDQVGYLYAEGGIMSPDGRCRPFDAAAAGTAGGSGGGVVLLKRLDAALRDGDTVYAVIKGSAANNDGADKVSYTAPSVAGQTAVIRDALRAARVSADSIGYVEAHGTGTPLGDPIEVRALAQAFAEAAAPGALANGRCGIGSIKGNIGHLDAAAGIAGFIKAVLALHREAIPPSINCETPNARIGFDKTPFSVVREARAWPRTATPRRAGVSSFGVGGTNVHVVLEEAPRVRAGESAEPSRWQLLPVSARSPSALREQWRQLRDALAHARPRVQDVAHTLQVGRTAFEHRGFAVVDAAADAPAQLDAAGSPPAFERRAAPPVVFMFPGQGSQYPGMGAALYRSGGVFQAEVDRCAQLLRAHLDRDVRSLMFDAGASLLRETRYTQPALFAIEYALARQWLAWGVTPHAMIGHSVGELVAAAVGETLALPDALALVVARADAMQRQPPGAMLAVLADARELAALNGPGCEIAAINGPEQYVLAGDAARIAALEDACIAAGVACQRLATSHAFHSSAMDGAAREIDRASERIVRRAARIPLISNRSGRWLNEQDLRDAGYWGEHVRQPVQFHAGVRTLLDALDAPIFVEVGPGRALGNLIGGWAGLGPQRIVATLPHARERRDDMAAALRGVGTLWAQGVDVNWAGLHAPGAARRIALPTYPFERTRHWIERPAGARAAPAREADGVPMRRGEDAADGSLTVSFALHERLWFLDEHRIFDGAPVLPGTACIELVRRAYSLVRPGAAMTMRDVYFPTALILSTDESRNVRVVFRPPERVSDGAAAGGDLAFVLESNDANGPAGWTPHASGRIGDDPPACAAPASLAALAALDAPAALREQWGLTALDDVAALSAQAFADYGARWRGVDALWLGERAGLARLRLPAAGSGDLPDFALHPAMLDVATAFLPACLRPRDASVPFRYESIRMHWPLRADCYSFAVETAPNVYDVTLFAWDEAARRADVLVAIGGFARREPAHRARDVAQWCRTVSWRDAPAARALPPERWLVFGDEWFALAPAGSVLVREDDAFRAHGDNGYGVRPGEKADCDRLIARLAEQGGVPAHVVYGWAQTDVDRAFAGLAALLQALGAHPADFRVSLVTKGARSARTLDACAAAAPAGLLKAVRWEYPRIVCRHIDIDDASDATIDALRAELSSEPATPPGAPPELPSSIALAGARREAPGFAALPAVARDDVLRDGGAYLITGGASGIGLELAAHIASRRRDVRLALLSRSPHDENAARFAALDEAAASVLRLTADVAHAAQLADALRTVRARFGRIDGVIHAAGVEASGLLETGTPDAWRRVMAAKVHGARHLFDQLAGDPPDFIVLCSSLAAVVGGLGQADYAAANGYMDALAQHWRQRGVAAIAIDWDTWSDTGMAFDHAARTRRSNDRPGALPGLANREGRALFDLALAHDASRIVISKRGFEQDRRDAPTRARRAAAPGDAQAALVALWQELLGVEQVGVDDDFFDLGGHSLLATQLISRVRDQYARSPTLGEFLEEPTIARILRAIDHTGGDTAGDMSGDTAGDAPDVDETLRYCVVPMVKAGSGAPFFCIPGMGGNITQLLPLANALGADRPVIGLQYLGLDGKHAPHASVEAIAAHYVRCIRSVQPAGPYFLGGHSLGGKIAYEVARRLHAQGDAIGLVAMFDSAAPPYSFVAHQDDFAIASMILGVFAYYAGKMEMMAGIDDARLRDAPRERLLAFMGERLAQFGVIQSQSDTSAIRGLFNVYRAAADFSARYAPPHEHLPLPILLVKATEPMPDGIKLPEIRETPAWGWENFTRLPVRTCEVAGNHYSCLMDGYVERIADALRDALASARQAIEA
ncbi:thiotemplate mechanism natural product synthetase [Burkholderia pseudomallei]|uniref:hybrid non-ribosomal peptide synthetase/type I polyketide synthase n=1 Tax=Burkholderia pseudomallei TaxID=28450 RepID=UPI000F099214|nr:hybrid non-ribosomal peptide synthetase/type I polyketide synthase [Burkholderia pseudomallei]VBN00878.1 thiotemplate mechanism natural product synthetase [Burkholderia pseudomallei]VCE40690.1 thiotemplate mechanism natural product synthetase [Burkholderia pseudomallei]